MNLATATHNRNSLWVDAILMEVREAGVRQAVVCPGGRSAALVVGLARAGFEIVHVATDERSAGFFALGLARASRTPVAICVTSGSAVANLLPALTEAEPLGVPLVVLAADRPGGRDSGLPQTTDQVALCLPAVRGSLALADPDVTAEALDALQAALGDLLARLGDASRGGPVHVNIPLHGEFTSADADVGWTPPPARPRIARAPAAAPPAPPRDSDWARLRALLPLRPGLRGLIVAGHDAPLSRQQVERLAGALRFPVLADAGSGLRRPPVAGLVCEADVLVLRPAILALSPELIIRLGPPPLSLTLQRYLAGSAAPALRLLRAQPRPDFLARDAPSLVDPTDADIDALIALLGPGDANWRELWLKQSADCRTRLDDVIRTLPWGECSAAHAVCTAPGYPLFHVANSMSARHANIYVGPHEALQRIFMNRGVNGIDGTVSTFLGELAGSGVPGLLLVGDQAMVHDMNGLEAARVGGLTGTICVMNNEGGSLFDLFGLPQLPGHARLIRNPTNVSFEAMAAVFGQPYRRCTTVEAVRAVLAEEPLHGRIRIIEMSVPAGSLLRDIEPLYRAGAGLG
jgi:2-succinyl-5-enolpyruvyl-6-hydroxy-3-cyclohexene-1-carboxylate synthase